MARTDSYAIEGLQASIDRASAYVEAGADGIFAEAMATLAEYQAYDNAINRPLLANMTEFGMSPLFDTKELSEHGVNMVLYPLTATRAMNKAAEMGVYGRVNKRTSTRHGCAHANSLGIIRALELSRLRTAIGQFIFPMKKLTNKRLITWQRIKN